MTKIFRGFLILLLISPLNALATSSLRFRLPAEPITLDWNLASTSAETHLLMNIMEGLTEHGADLKPHPALAERWEISPDGLTYRFYLKKGVKWTDGKPLSASQFRDSWLRLLTPKTGASYASFLHDIVNAEAFSLGKIKDPNQVGIKALNASVLEVKLRRIVPYFLHLPTFWVTFPIRLDLIKKYGEKWTDPKNLVTLGPYRLQSWQKEKELVLQRNALYDPNPGPKPSIEEIHILIEKSDTIARQWFNEGKVDFLLDATTDDFLKAKNKVSQNEVTARQFPYLATFYLGFRTDQGPLKKKQVRQIFCSTLDKPSISAALQGGQTPATGWIPPGIPGHVSSPAPTPPSLFQAKAILAAEGFPEGQGFPKLLLVMNRFDGSENLADFLAKTWRSKLGLDIETQIVSAKDYVDSIKKDKASLFVGHWGADYPDASNFYEVFTSQAGTNRTGWKNPEYDSLLTFAQSTLDETQRMTFYKKAETLLTETHSVICPLFYKPHTVLIGPRVTEFSISPLNYLFLKYSQIK